MSTQISDEFFRGLVEARSTTRRRINRDFVSLFNDLLPLFDCVCVIIAGYLCSLIYDYSLGVSGSLPEVWAELRRGVVVGALVVPFVLHDREFYRQGEKSGYRMAFANHIVRFGMYAGVTSAIVVALQQFDAFPATWMAGWFGLSLLMTLSFRVLLTRQLQVLENKGIFRETIAIVGAGPLADRLIQHLYQVKPGGVEIIGVFDDRSARPAVGGVHAPSGTLHDLIELGKKRNIDCIMVTLPCTAEHRLLAITHKLKTLAVAVALCPEQVGLALPYKMLDYVGDGLPVTLLADRPLRRWTGVVKSVEDRLLGGLLTLCFLPVMGLIALAVRLDSPGPVIFKQTRHGWSNREFQVYKFRTMRWQPETSSTDSALKQTARNDSRVTKLGAFLRKTSLDELPQLFNVLNGDMSLVGPRPHAVNMRTETQLGHEIIEVYAHRHRVKPGITGWAQVNGYRGATEKADQLRKRVEYDIYYVEHCSLFFDLKILVLTFFHLIKAKNAY